MSPEGSSILTAPLMAPRLAPIASQIWSTVCSGGSQTRSQAHSRPAMGGRPSADRMRDQRSTNLGFLGSHEGYASDSRTFSQY